MSNPTTLSDNEILGLYKKNENPDLVGELFNRYSHLVFGVCLKYLGDKDECKDAVMQIFENLFDDLKKNKIDNFKNWLYSVARNYCLMAIRHNNVVLKHKDAEYKNLKDNFVEFISFVHPIETADQSEMLNKVTIAFQQLKEGQRQCIEMFYLKEKSYKEISDDTGFSINEIKSYIQNGKRKLKIILEKNV